MDTRPPAYPSAASMARELDVSERTVWDWSRRGILPKPIRLSNGCVRWIWSDVQAALASLAAGGTGESDPFMKGVRDATSPQ